MLCCWRVDRSGDWVVAGKPERVRKSFQSETRNERDGFSTRDGRRLKPYGVKQSPGEI